MIRMVATPTNVIPPPSPALMDIASVVLSADGVFPDPVTTTLLMTVRVETVNRLPEAVTCSKLEACDGSNDLEVTN